MLRKPHFIVLLVAGLVVLALLALPERARSRVRIAVGSLFVPLFGLTGSAQALADRTTGAAAPRSMLVARVTSLEEECRRLRIEGMEARAAAQENDRLRQMLGYGQRDRWRLKPARVIGRDPANWWQAVHLDVGRLDGVTTNLAVLAPDGLVGRVAEVGPHRSRVVLVGDPNCPVAAALAGSNETGIIRSSSVGELHGEVVDLSFLPRSANVKPGQRVITSGQGGVFPAGIPVGEVIDVRVVDVGVYLEARVRLTVELGAVDHVWVRLP